MTATPLYDAALARHDARLADQGLVRIPRPVGAVGGDRIEQMPPLVVKEPQR